MYRALISFSGLISMAKGDVRVISDASIVKDLLKAGYIEPFEEEKPEPKKRKKNTPKGA